MEEAQQVLVIGEVDAGRISATTAELLAAGHTLAQQAGGTVALSLLGHNLQAASAEAIQFGADRVYAVDDPQFAIRQADVYLAALQQVCSTVAPRMILLGRTAMGRDIAPRLACRLGVTLLQDCLEVAIDPDTGCLTGVRPVYGGNVLAHVRSTSTPQVAAIRPKAYAPLASDSSRHGEIVPVSVTVDASTVRVTVLRQELDDSPGIRLEDARVVVAGGRGLGGPEPFRELQELAGVLHAGIGASRAAVDAGWVPGTWQIGLTGKTITPELYITVGISGASQHMAGCSGSKVIVAINKDREANIFRAARYGVVGDWRSILPAFLQALRDL
jgi:electron transfer flavoprotein alpha subunit